MAMIAQDVGCAAEGGFVHVYVDRHTRRPAPLDDRLRNRLLELTI